MAEAAVLVFIIKPRILVLIGVFPILLFVLRVYARILIT